ncbi:MAG: RNA pseudouridine synthase [Bacteroidetes bacterium]|nr:RNA pseudouridine synthase [Bacteroidota bacterium]
MHKNFPEIIFENEDFVVVNKPAGMLSIPDREGKEQSLKSILKNKYGSIFTVHRLDKETSGAIVFAKNEGSHKFLSESFEERSVKKIYLGIVTGTLSDKKASISIPLMEHPVKKGLMVTNKKGKPSITEYDVQEEFGLYSLVQFQIHTGRMHQIRVHMQYIGHPIVCDELYGSGEPVFLSSIKKKFKLSRSEEQETPMLARLGLHSYQLEFADQNGKTYQFEAPLAKDMKALLQQLRKWR